MAVFAEITKIEKIRITTENVDIIFSLPPIPFEKVQQEEIIADKTITILPNECAFVLRKDNITSLSAVVAKHLIADIFVIFKGQDEAFFCVHINNVSDLHIEKYLLQLCSQNITVEIIGAVEDDFTARVLLERIVESLIKITNKYNLNITFTRQRIGKYFLPDEFSYLYLINDFVLEKAKLIYKNIFKKSLPQKLIELKFDTDYAINVSPIQGFEDALKEIAEINKQYTNNAIEKSNALRKYITYAGIIESLDKNKFFSFCTFLVEENPLQSKTKSIENRLNFASSEIIFNYIYKALFCRNGYDALRLVLALNDSMPRCLAPEIGFDFATMKIFRPPYLDSAGEYTAIRWAKIFSRDIVPTFHECYKAGQYQKPLLAKEILTGLKIYAHLLRQGGQALETLANNIKLSFSGISPKQERIIFSIIEDYIANSTLYEAEVDSSNIPNENKVLKTEFRFTNYIVGELSKSVRKSSSFLGNGYFSNLKKCESIPVYVQQLQSITGKKFSIQEENNYLNAIFKSSCTEELNHVKNKLEEVGINSKIGINTIEIANIESCDLKLAGERRSFSS